MLRIRIFSDTLFMLVFLQKGKIYIVFSNFSIKNPIAILTFPKCCACLKRKLLPSGTFNYIIENR